MTDFNQLSPMERRAWLVNYQARDAVERQRQTIAWVAKEQAKRNAEAIEYSRKREEEAIELEAKRSAYNAECQAQELAWLASLEATAQANEPELTSYLTYPSWRT
jgi:hypothetical protein